MLGYVGAVRYSFLRLKALSGIMVTPSGTRKLFSVLHPANGDPVRSSYGETVVQLSGVWTDVRAVPQNASGPMDVTLSGNVMLVKF